MRRTVGSGETPKQISLDSVPIELNKFVSKKMKSFNCSAHDEDHVHRVANLALIIAEECQKTSVATINMKIVFVSSLLHDALDSKLQSSESIQQSETEIWNFLSNLKTKSGTTQFLTEGEINTILVIIKSVGYKNLTSPTWYTNNIASGKLPQEYYCVQDSDLLDAIGY